jgi:preprotein translocase subunit YajC
VDIAVPYLILLAVALLFWFAVLRPQQRRQQSVRQMQSALSVGDEVMLTSGIIGVLRSLDEKTVELEVADGVTLKAVRAAVGQIMTPVARDVDTGVAAEGADEPEEK